MKFYVWNGKAEHRAEYQKCELCEKQPFTNYMVKSELWPKQHKFLCLSCFQKTIQRNITIDDFVPCQMTNLVKLGFLLGSNQDVDLSDF